MTNESTEPEDEDYPPLTDEERERYKPGTFGCHEGLHMTNFLCQAVESELLSHPSIRSNPEWQALANKAFDTLFELYQAIALEHV